MGLHLTVIKSTIQCKAEYTFLFSAKFSSTSYGSRRHLQSISPIHTTTFSSSHHAMELLWDFALTLAVSLLLPSLFIKLLSIAPSDDADDAGVAVTSRDCGVASDVLIAGKFDEFRGESILEKLLEANCGSPKIHENVRKIDENRGFSEIEVVDLTENNNHVEISEVDEEVEMSKPMCEKNCNEIIGESEKKGVNCENKEWLEEDDWEGIESTELERRFGAAVLFVESKTNANRIVNLSNDVKMQLYGFHKIATQGPCQKPQPMALNFSARAKWNAWQQLGIMSAELAMEQYITILSNSIPDWMPHSPIENDKSTYADIQAFE